MDNIFKLKSIIAILLFLISFNVLSDTYPVVVISDWVQRDGTHVSETAAINFECSYWTGAGSTYTITSETSSVAWFNCHPANNPNSNYNAHVGAFLISTCPNGGSVSGSSCINAPACISPNIRKTVSPYSCSIPVECRYPESDNGSGICANNTCPVGQTRNPVTNSCQVSPTCGATETLNTVTNLCELNKIKCPGHAHASTDNSQCLADAPNACPMGQHDDGTYTCVANDPTRCTSNQTAGYINGIPQCINKSNLDQEANDKQPLDTNLQTAITAANNAAAALAADPTNTVKQQTNTTAQQTLQDTKAATDQANSKLSNDALKKISDSVDNIDKRQISDNAAGFGLTPTPDTITSNTWQGSVGYSSVGGICPAPQTIVLSRVNITMTYQPYCNFAMGIRPVVLAMAFLGAGLIVLGVVRE